jgi:integrase
LRVGFRRIDVRPIAPGWPRGVARRERACTCYPPRRLAFRRSHCASVRSVREGFLEPAEFEAVSACLPAYLQDAARFAYLTCWRVGAIRALEWGDVDLRARTLQLRAASAKNKRAKVIPLAGDLLVLLEHRAETRDPALPYVFTGADGGRLGDFARRGDGPQRRPASAGSSSTIYADPPPGTRSEPACPNVL